MISRLSSIVLGAGALPLATPACRQPAPQAQPQAVDRFLADPAAMVPGTGMGFPGIDDPAERRTLIAWLSR